MNSLSWQDGLVKEIIREQTDYQEVRVQIDEVIRRVINYPLFTGVCNVGDIVALNTTAMELSLGTGGFDFVMFNYSNNDKELIRDKGHIMKLRYTPYQFKTLSVEEQDSPYHEQIKDFSNLFNMPIVVGTLHSQVSVFFEAYRYLTKEEKKTTVYIMTDAASLPIQLSNNIRTLKNNDIINHTITIGNAFGGDFEAVNIYSALAFAKQVLQADTIMICMGPGIVGTGTKYGFTGIEQGYLLDAIMRLGGKPIALPRISFSDLRDRHKGLSHHSITILKDIVNSSCVVPYNIVDSNKLDYFTEQIKNNKLDKKHEFMNMKKNNYKKFIDSFLVNPSSMGRTYKDEPYLFDACIAAADFIIGGNH